MLVNSDLIFPSTAYKALNSVRMNIIPSFLSIFSSRYNYFGSQQLTDKFNSDMAQFQGILMLPCFSDEAWMPICSRALQRLTPKKYLKVAFGDPQQFSLIRDYWVTKGLSKYPSTGELLTKSIKYPSINTSDSFAIPIGGERVTWVCINLCL